jgi:hypothetical protein
LKLPLPQATLPKLCQSRLGASKRGSRTALWCLSPGAWMELRVGLRIVILERLGLGRGADGGG